MEIRVPRLTSDTGEEITEATLLSWKKSAGDGVREGEVICELEVGKAIVAVEAESSGYLEIEVEEGQMVAIGAIIGYIRESA